MTRNQFNLFKPEGTGGTQNIWVTTYSDMMTNLMMFFLILWAYTQFIHSKKEVPVLPNPQAVENVAKLEIQKELEQVGAVVLTGQKITVTLPSAVLFDSGSAELKAEALEPLAKVAASLAKSTAPIVVEGHTDDIPIQRSRWRSNYELSSARAFSVIRFFTQQSIPPHRLAARGYGPFRPGVSNTSDENRALNRRIEIHLWM
ncbi:MAG: OmpA family protein [Elusimicrobia bacterium]|nr:OmpA family protein [Elusimicrobiota bacterium]